MGQARRSTVYLVKCTNRGHENDGIRIIKVWYPWVSLATSTAHIEEMPRNGFSMNSHVKYMFSNAHGLNASMQYVIYERRSIHALAILALRLTSRGYIIRRSDSGNVFEKATWWLNKGTTWVEEQHTILTTHQASTCVWQSFLLQWDGPTAPWYQIQTTRASAQHRW